MDLNSSNYHYSPNYDLIIKLIRLFSHSRDQKPKRVISIMYDPITALGNIKGQLILT